MLIRTARKLIILVTGVTVVVVGIAMLVTPGPGIIVIPAGLAILATEFAWARHVLKRFKAQADSVVATFRNMTGARPSPRPPKPPAKSPAPTPLD